ncbi:hypothetical protein HN592_04730 [Candidatus Woesearchaeota archaeon]|jgi:hypothetical protein|nr:hypothetical protein [Candidatus Woesearchaeota archaeon]MBT4368518.1 hypothetical protein [Candidatus Woesearchaeota archaeon]MBT4713007.1 hypothetical protein [Candidatus Woesearchaeota archaeon]MBT6639919.1 hypothetical protein [Candidatus Woesearchaeota archaeon]MBT7134091.1 hypothetical protein [Candidatus Woesearchaeota archaeon]
MPTESDANDTSTKEPDKELARAIELLPQHIPDLDPSSTAFDVMDLGAFCLEHGIACKKNYAGTPVLVPVDPKGEKIYDLEIEGATHLRRLPQTNAWVDKDVLHDAGIEYEAGFLAKKEPKVRKFPDAYLVERCQE